MYQELIPTQTSAPKRSYVRKDHVAILMHHQKEAPALTKAIRQALDVAKTGIYNGKRLSLFESCHLTKATQKAQKERLRLKTINDSTSIGILQFTQEVGFGVRTLRSYNLYTLHDLSSLTETLSTEIRNRFSDNNCQIPIFLDILMHTMLNEQG